MGYADYLSSTSTSITMDQKTFKAWERGEISTMEAYERYLFNNSVQKPPLYHKALFEYWLNSLGYRRSLYAKED